MIQIPKVLVVDDATVVREMLSAVLSPHCEQIMTASDCASARSCLRDHPDVSLVLCDVLLPDGTGHELLEEIARIDGARPDVIMMTGRPSEEGELQARTLGAIGYLSKPICFRAIAQVVHRTEGKRNAARRYRGLAAGRAYLLGPLEAIGSALRDDVRRVWDIRDISVSGAFLETPGPVEVGRMLDLCLDFGDDQVSVRARTVRVQEPDWGRMGGIGVAFVGLDRASRSLIESRLAELEATAA